MDAVVDQGARFLSAIASVTNSGNGRESEQDIERKIRATLDTLADPAGTFYRFGMAGSLLQRARSNGKKGGKGEAQ